MPCVRPAHDSIGVRRTPRSLTCPPLTDAKAANFSFCRISFVNNVVCALFDFGSHQTKLCIAPSRRWRHSRSLNQQRDEAIKLKSKQATPSLGKLIGVSTAADDRKDEVLVGAITSHAWRTTTSSGSWKSNAARRPDQYNLA